MSLKVDVSRTKLIYVIFEFVFNKTSMYSRSKFCPQKTPINWYMDTSVRDLEVACFKANSTWINDIGSKDLSNRPMYAVLNTHNLDMIRQLKYMPIVMDPARLGSSDWKS